MNENALIYENSVNRHARRGACGAKEQRLSMKKDENSAKKTQKPLTKKKKGDILLRHKEIA